MIYAAARAASQTLLRAETGDRGEASTERRGDSVARPFHVVFLPKRGKSATRSLPLQGKIPKKEDRTMAKTSEEVVTQSVQGVRRSALPEVTWEDIHEPGTYVERG